MVVVKTGEEGSRKQAWQVEDNNGEENGGDEGEDETDKMKRKNEEKVEEEELQPQSGNTDLARMILI